MRQPFLLSSFLIWLHPRKVQLGRALCGESLPCLFRKMQSRARWWRRRRNLRIWWGFLVDQVCGWSVESLSIFCVYILWPDEVNRFASLVCLSGVFVCVFDCMSVFLPTCFASSLIEKNKTKNKNKEKTRQTTKMKQEEQQSRTRHKKCCKPAGMTSLLICCSPSDWQTQLHLPTAVVLHPWDKGIDGRRAIKSRWHPMEVSGVLCEVPGDLSASILRH